MDIQNSSYVGSGQNLKPTDANKVTPSQIKKVPIKENNQIFINDKTGSIHLIGLDKTKSIKEVFDQNLRAGEVLIVAGKLLANDKLTADEKKLKKTAKKVIKCCIKESPLSKEKINTNTLSDKLNAAGLSIKQQAYIQKENHAEAEINSKIKVYANSKVKELTNAKEVVASNFKNISAYGSAHSNNGQDFLRHLMGGMVHLKDNNQEILEENTVPANGKLSDKQKVAIFKNRAEGVIFVFESKVVKNATEDELLALKVSTEKLIDEISSAPNDGVAAATLDAWLLNWASSANPAEQNMCRLIHSMNQLYDIGTVSGPILLVKDDGNPDSPHHLLHLNGLTLEPDKSTKKIEYEFTQNDVTVTHRITLNVNLPMTSKDDLKKSKPDQVFIEQVTTLKANLDNLENWESSSVLNVNSDGRTTIDTANNLYRIFNIAGFDTELNTPKFA